MRLIAFASTELPINVNAPFHAWHMNCSSLPFATICSCAFDATEPVLSDASKCFTRT